MKYKTLSSSLIALSLVVVIFNSCKKDEGFTQVTAFEREILSSINDYRATMGKPAMTETFLMIDDAQGYSKKMADGSAPFLTAGVDPELAALKKAIGADSSGVWVAKCEYEEADSVMKIIKNDPKIVSLLMADFNLSAVGTAQDLEGTYFITNLLLRKPKP